MQKNRLIILIVSLFFLLGVVNYFSGLTIDVTRDAGKYATAAKEIYQNGNLVNLTIHGEPYDQKPPLLFWLSALGFTVGNVSNFWFKLPVLLLVFAGFFWAFKLGESLYNKRVGRLTAVLLFFSFIYSLYSMDIHTDTPLQAFVTLALWQLFEFIKTGRTRNWLTGFAAIGLAMLSKGPIGAAIPAFAVVGHLLFTKRFKSFLDIRWYLGVIIALIVVSPALVGLMNQFGWQGIRFFFWENMVGRITGSYVKAINDPLFYVHNLLYQLLPWSLIFFIVVFLEFKTLIKNRFRSFEYITLTGIWIYFIILNSASSQLPNYVFAIVPLMAVLAAKWIDIAVRQNQKIYHVFFGTQLFTALLLWFIIGLIVLWLFPVVPLYYWSLFIIGIISSVFILMKKDNVYIKMLAPALIAFTCLVFLLNTQIFRYIFSFQAPPKAAKYFNENAAAGDTLYNYKYGQYELFFYSEPQAVQLHNFRELKKVAGKDGAWIFTDNAGFEEMEKLQLSPDTVIQYKHLYLNRGGKFINPKTRDEVLQNMYLLKF